MSELCCFDYWYVKNALSPFIVCLNVSFMTNPVLLWCFLAITAFTVVWLVAKFLHHIRLWIHDLNWETARFHKKLIQRNIITEGLCFKWRLRWKCILTYVPVQSSKYIYFFFLHTFQWIFHCLVSLMPMGMS